MSLTVEQTDAAIRETFYNMDEGVDYVLNDFWFQEANRVRKQYGYSIVKQKQDCWFSRKGNRLFLNDSLVFDFDGKHNLAFTLSFALSFARSFAFVLQHNGFEKLNKDTCAGKVVEIDGKKYKLIEVQCYLKK